MRVALIIEPVGETPTTWANLLDCERAIMPHGKYIYDNYDALPDILIFTRQDLLDHDFNIDYFKILELCRYKDMRNIETISEMTYAVRATVIKKESREYYLSALGDDLKRKFDFS